MPTRLATWLIAGLMATATLAMADTVILTDGRAFTGTATQGSDQVTVETPYGTVVFPVSQVAQIDLAPSPESQLAARLTAVRPNDAEGLFQTATWAIEQGLAKQAVGLYRQVLLIDHEHAGARRALGHVQIDRRWLEFEPALEVLRSRINYGQPEAGLDAMIAQMQAIAPTGSASLTLKELSATLQLRRGRFAQAREAFGELAKSTQPAATAARLAAIEQILAENADGFYVLTEAYPPEAALLGPTEGQRVLPAGPASLAEPLAMEAALRDKARQRVVAGRAMLAEGRPHEADQPDRARQAYQRAEAEFDAADALVADIARSYKIEIARRQIAMLRKETDSHAVRFDAELATLGRQALPAQAYAAKVQTMLRSLRGIATDLDAILQLARPYERELILEVRWAELDKTKIEAMTATLRQELNETRLGRAD